MKIIDAHVHVIQNIAGFGAKGELRAIGNGQAMWSTGDIINLIPPELGEDSVTYEAVVKFMDENNIEKAVLLQGSLYGSRTIILIRQFRSIPNGLPVLQPTTLSALRGMPYGIICSISWALKL